MPDLDLVISALTKLTNSPPAVLLFFGLIAWGYVCKIIPSFPNDRIPLVNLIVALVIYPLFAKADLYETYSMRFPWLGALVRDEITALCVFAGSWITHWMILKRFLDRFIPNSVNENGDTKLFRKDEIVKPIPLTPPDRKD